jgi:hypothetical protein
MGKVCRNRTNNGWWRFKYYEKFEDTKGVIRRRKSKKFKQCHGQKDKQQYPRHYIDRATWTPIKTKGELRCPGRVGSSCSICINYSVPIYIKYWGPLLNLRLS